MFILDEVGKGVIHAIKYQGAREVLNDMPHWLDRSAGYRDFLKGAHLVPVPLHRRRESKRGFNQSLWIAHAIKKDLGSVVEVGDFIRLRDVETGCWREATIVDDGLGNGSFGVELSHPMPWIPRLSPPGPIAGPTPPSHTSLRLYLSVHLAPHCMCRS